MPPLRNATIVVQRHGVHLPSPRRGPSVWHWVIVPSVPTISSLCSLLSFQYIFIILFYFFWFSYVFLFDEYLPPIAHLYFMVGHAVCHWIGRIRPIGTSHGPFQIANGGNGNQHKLADNLARFVSALRCHNERKEKKPLNGTQRMKSLAWNTSATKKEGSIAISGRFSYGGHFEFAICYE